MIKITQSSPNPTGIHFPDDATRAVSFRAFAKPKDAITDVTYSIDTPGATFSNGFDKLIIEGVPILAGGSVVNQSLSFKKQEPGALQLVVSAHIQARPPDSGEDATEWVISVLQAPQAKAAEEKGAFLEAAGPGQGDAEAVDAASAQAAGDALENVAAYPADRSELLHARHLLKTLQAAVDAALAADSFASEAPSDTES